jgi:hypothetical protein
VTVFIDAPTWPGHGRLWSHLVSDVSYAELHAFAANLGLPPRAFERDHYDVIAERYDSAITAGAVPVTSREIVARLTAAGLRRRKKGLPAGGWWLSPRPFARTTDQTDPPGRLPGRPSWAGLQCGAGWSRRHLQGEPQ